MEHLSWVADVRWVDATINRTMASAVGGALERRCDWAERVGEDVKLLFWAANRVTKKLK